MCCVCSNKRLAKAAYRGFEVPACWVLDNKCWVVLAAVKDLWVTYGSVRIACTGVGGVIGLYRSHVHCT
jgi:hypothetical protein